MSFIADKQTLEDLNLLGKYRPHSILGIFNKVATHGGERLLEEMFAHPLSDADAINARADMFTWFQKKGIVFPFAGDEISLVENYLGMGAGSNRVASTAGVMFRKLAETFVRDEQYRILLDGLRATIKMLRALKGLMEVLDERESPFRMKTQQLKDFFSYGGLAELLYLPGELSWNVVAKYDYLLKKEVEMEMVMEIVYQLDVCIAVGNVAREKGFSYASALPAGEHVFQTSGLRHPGLDKGVANPLMLHKEKNMLFLTGANMAGKSTFMKAFGIAVYLGHMGFPVAASDMVFSVREGLYSSINVSDDLEQGFSHFYAEVLRVKKVAEEVGKGRDLVVIFDELFKGTNVKDAYDATWSVTAALAEYRNCLFVISTHIVEVGEVLQSRGGQVQFSFLPTVMEGTVPRYPYIMREGISEDKHGMMIIRNEGIIELLSN